MDTNSLLTCSQAVKELGIPRQSVLYWMNKLTIEKKHTIPFGKKSIFFISKEDVNKINEARKSTSQQGDKP